MLESTPAIRARRLVIRGQVQGVGFRPFAYRLASSLALRGWVRNGAGLVVIHVEGPPAQLHRFEAALIDDAPYLARPRLASSAEAVPEDAVGFRILASESAEPADVHVPPDLFCCDACAAELADPAQRRHGYAFTNCTQCGPRYTLIAALPYDRANTSMADFALCPRCRAEYENPLDRRFHAEPLACPDCGPRLSFRRDGAAPCRDEVALRAAVACLRDGGIVAVKGVGGYHLMCDAASDAAVRRLRARKRRPAKPLAVMFAQRGADGLAAVRECVSLGDAEALACTAPARPIVLARRTSDGRLSPSLAPGLGELGVLLPYSPLHHLLLTRFGGPLVATSGNVSGEPVITDPAEADARLAPVADAFLHHDRPILRPADDSVLRVLAGRPRAIRLGRGMGPLEIDLPYAMPTPTLAVGGHMKAAIALGWGRRALLSPHIGDLDSPRALRVFEQLIADLPRLYGVEPARVVCDAHPGYASTRWARAQPLPVRHVDHHRAHAAALAAEHPEIDRWLTFTWDGVGLGERGESWGGEAFVGAPGAWRRVASMRPFHVLGAARAGREPWRSAAALMWQAGHEYLPAVEHAALAREAWRKGIRSAPTSSVGRLFDAAASLVLGLTTVSFEAQAPMRLESAAASGCTAAGGCTALRLPLARDGEGIWRTEWAPLLPMLVDRRLPEGERAGIFHESLAHALLGQVAAVFEEEPIQAVGLTGGVFQNRVLAERVLDLLEARGLRAHLPRLAPVNDGGLALGQLLEVCRG